MSDKKEQTKRESSEDPELDDLLDSALEDFSKKGKKEESKPKPLEKDEKELSTPEWADEFIKQAASKFENISGLLETAPGGAEAVTQEQLQQSLQKMAEAAAQVVADPQAVPVTQETCDFASTISQTLQNLSLGAENLQNPFSGQDIMNMFGNAGDNSGANAYLPFMQGMLQSLLSKEVLYPALKDVLDKYPAWLGENKSKIDANSHEKYTKQMNLMKEICDELEKEQETDDENVKQERFDTVLDLMHKMQDLGAPPTDLVGEMENIPFNMQGNVDLENFNMNDPNQCSLM